jgi:hypothetical protein
MTVGEITNAATSLESGKDSLLELGGESEHGLSNANKSTIRIGRTNSNLVEKTQRVETQSVEDHPQKPRHHGHPADRQRKTNYQHENIIHVFLLEGLFYFSASWAI